MEKNFKKICPKLFIHMPIEMKLCDTGKKKIKTRSHASRIEKWMMKKNFG
jgi:hypothetical protein